MQKSLLQDSNEPADLREDACEEEFRRYSVIQCAEYVKDEFSGAWGCELSRIQPDKFLKLKYHRKERKEYIINFVSCSVAVIRCWEREADIREVRL